MQIVVNGAEREVPVGTTVAALLGLLGVDRTQVAVERNRDVVPKKKPDPAIYLLAAKTLGLDPQRCVVIEDSHIGLQAAKSAGWRITRHRLKTPRNRNSTSSGHSASRRIS